MITILSLYEKQTEPQDEVWAIVRSPKKLPKGVLHVPELAPSWELFSKYLELKTAGNWNEETFQNIYVPDFLKEMNMITAQEKLQELVEKSNQGLNITLKCFCQGTLCHRFIIAGLLQAKGIEVHGVDKDCSSYGKDIFTVIPLSEIPSIAGKGYTSMCFTGHRPKDLCGYTRSRYVPFVDQLERLLDQYYKSGIRRFITGGAQGFDQLAFWAVHNLKRKYDDIENILYLPFPGQELVWLETGCFSRTDFRQMLEYVDEIKYCTKTKPEDKSGIVKALELRNHRMVDDTDFVCALQKHQNWRMIPYGGTANCMQYAMRRQKTIHRYIPNMVLQFTIIDYETA